MNLWIFHEAFTDRVHSWFGFFKCAPAVWIAACLARDVPRLWWIVVSLFLLQWELLPVNHYLIPALPFLCLLAAKGYERCAQGRWPEPVLLLISIPLVLGVGKDIIRPFGLFGHRVYGLMDTHYEVDVERKQKLTSPIWTNDYNLAYEMGWPLIGKWVIPHDITNATIDWNKPPYDKVMTRVELLPACCIDQAAQIVGWTSYDIPLIRGQFTTMRIRRRNE